MLTSYLFLASGLPGPFVNLGKFKFGDKVIFLAYKEYDASTKLYKKRVIVRAVLVQVEADK